MGSRCVLRIQLSLQLYNCGSRPQRYSDYPGLFAGISIFFPTPPVKQMSSFASLPPPPQIPVTSVTQGRLWLLCSQSPPPSRGHHSWILHRPLQRSSSHPGLWFLDLRSNVFPKLLWSNTRCHHSQVSLANEASVFGLPIRGKSPG